MFNQPIAILLIDDDEVDRLAVKRALHKCQSEFILTEITRGNEVETLLGKQSFDIILLDYRLPDLNGLELINKIQNLGVDKPLIVLTGQGDELIAVEIMKAGAADYLSKDKISVDLLEKSIKNAIRVHQAELEVKLAHQRIKKTNKLLFIKNQELEKQKYQIKLQNMQLQEAYKLKSDFLATMSHELRTPLNAIIGFSELLSQQYPEPLSSQQLEIVDRILYNGKNLLNMINEILEFSRLEAGKVELDCRLFNLEILVNFTVEELRSLAMSKKIMIQVDYQLNSPWVKSDENYLKRILINLLGNAIKFTETGEVKVTLAESEAERIIIAVKDTGIGISAADLENIFQAFRQGDQSLTRKHTGTGLGLAITDSLVTMLQGTISVTSELGRGSVFTVEIPRQIQLNSTDDQTRQIEK